MTWNVLYTRHAELDLRGIYEHIAYSLLEPEIAIKQSGRIMDAALSLEQIPLRFSLYDKEPWRSRGLRFMPVDNYLLFYIPDEEKATVTIIRIMYGGRDIEKQLNDSRENK